MSNTISSRGNVTVLAPVTTSVATASPRVSETSPAASVNAPAKRETESSTVDTVALINKLQDAKKEESSQEKPKQEPARLADVLFAYNNKGDLRIKFMDSVNYLVYQMPPVMVAKMTDIMNNPASSVNTKV